MRLTLRLPCYITQPHYEARYKLFNPPLAAAEYIYWRSAQYGWVTFVTTGGDQQKFHGLVIITLGREIWEESRIMDAMVVFCLLQWCSLDFHHLCTDVRHLSEIRDYQLWLHIRITWKGQGEKFHCPAQAPQ